MVAAHVSTHTKPSRALLASAFKVTSELSVVPGVFADWRSAGTTFLRGLRGRSGTELHRWHDGWGLQSPVGRRWGRPCTCTAPVLSCSGVFSAIGRIFKEEGILGFFVYVSCCFDTFSRHLKVLIALQAAPLASESH